ncbi:hypothetical protein EYF80_036134 [Liparis tanakae]|uniref:Uncharacterized protein n=1 Tax=Liparis tanakae TaxID=230148 RepID=A0A4Z2GJD2_9TELE|nr:hypothetical protein EYF80_036134 [Liparis tanakae]
MGGGEVCEWEKGLVWCSGGTRGVSSTGGPDEFILCFFPWLSDSSVEEEERADPGGASRPDCSSSSSPSMGPLFSRAAAMAAFSSSQGLSKDQRRPSPMGPLSRSAEGLRFCRDTELLLLLGELERSETTTLMPAVGLRLPPRDDSLLSEPSDVLERASDDFLSFPLRKKVLILLRRASPPSSSS